MMPNRSISLFVPVVFVFLFSVFWFSDAVAQPINAKYVNELYRRYPTQKSDFCSSCKLWVNPYFRSIADTAQHRPLLTYMVYTRAQRLQQEAIDLPRAGIYGAWHPAYGQPSETAAYRLTNKQINLPDQDGEIQKGHCQAWILLAWSVDGALLSDTYTFNSAMEYRGQNLGTEIETEELCRQLTGYRVTAVTDSVRIWCGTFGARRTYTQGKLRMTVPSHYYKVITYREYGSNRQVTRSWWLPNLPSESREMLPQRECTYAELVVKLGFDPQKVFH